MKILVAFSLAVTALITFNASATLKTCDGGHNASSVLGMKIVLDFTADHVAVKSTPKGYEDAIGKYPKDKASAGQIVYQGGDLEEQDGYTFTVDASLLNAGTTGPMTVRLDSGIEGYLDADYTCHD